MNQSEYMNSPYSSSPSRPRPRPPLLSSIARPSAPLPPSSPSSARGQQYQNNKERAFTSQSAQSSPNQVIANYSAVFFPRSSPPPSASSPPFLQPAFQRGGGHGHNKRNKTQEDDEDNDEEIQTIINQPASQSAPTLASSSLVPSRSWRPAPVDCDRGAERVKREERIQETIPNQHLADYELFVSFAVVDSAAKQIATETFTLPLPFTAPFDVRSPQQQFRVLSVLLAEGRGAVVDTINRITQPRLPSGARIKRPRSPSHSQHAADTPIRVSHRHRPSAPAAAAAVAESVIKVNEQPSFLTSHTHFSHSPSVLSGSSCFVHCNVRFLFSPRSPVGLLWAHSADLSSKTFRQSANMFWSYKPQRAMKELFKIYGNDVGRGSDSAFVTIEFLEEFLRVTHKALGIRANDNGENEADLVGESESGVYRGRRLTLAELRTLQGDLLPFMKKAQQKLRKAAGKIQSH